MRKGVLAILLLVSFAANPRAHEMPSPEALVKLSNTEFLSAMDDPAFSFYDGTHPYSSEQILALLEKTVTALKETADAEKSAPYSNVFSTLFEEACRRVSDHDLDHLVAIYTSPAASFFDRTDFLSEIASRLLGREIPLIKAEQRKVILEGAPAKLPPEMAIASSKLQDAWQLYQRAKAPYENSFPKPAERIEAQANKPSFTKITADVLKGANGLETKLQKFSDDGTNCLDITEVEDTKGIAMLLMLVRERKLDLAIGAALRVAGASGSISSPEKSFGSIIMLFEACGIDWETIFLGAATDRQLKVSLARKEPFLEALAIHGSPRVAPFILELARAATTDARSVYAPVLASWIPATSHLKDARGEEICFFAAATPRRETVMPVNIQEESLRLLETFVTPDSSTEIKEEALSAFASAGDISSIPSLRILASDRSSYLSVTASQLLAAMGSPIESIVSANPVRFRILINGVPAPEKTRLSWDTLSDHQTLAGKFSETSAEGFVDIPQDSFTNGTQSAEVIAFYSSDSMNRLEDERSSDSPIFNMTIPAPKNLRSIIDVPLSLNPVQIVLENGQDLSALPDKLFVRFQQRFNDQDPPSFDPHSDYSVVGLNRNQQNGSMAASLHFSAVQEGDYDLELYGVGIARSRQKVKVGPGPSQLIVALRPGSDLHFRIIGPNGFSAGFATILKDGARFAALLDRESDTYRSLPYGNYTIRIPGSEVMAEYREKMHLQKGPDEVDYPARDISFEIKPGSPRLIDLGDIVLGATAAK